MKEVKITKYLLTAKERQVIDEYVKWLTNNPLPCTECYAQCAKKCLGYNIFSLRCDEEEECNVVKKWFTLSEDYRHNFRNLVYEDVKTMINNRYNLELIRKKQNNVGTELIIAENRVNQDTGRIGQDFGVDPSYQENLDNLFIARD